MTDTRPRTTPVGTGNGVVDGRLDAAVGGRGFQPAARRRNRIAFGVVLAAVAVGGNVLAYTSLSDARPVVQVVRDVPAGTEITADMLRTVDVDADGSVNLVEGDRVDSLVGTYAKVRLVSGSLVTAESVQPEPLVSDGNAVVAVQVPEGSLPIGLRERVPVLLVLAAERTATAPAPPISIEGRVVGLPESTGSALAVESVSVEVAREDAATVAAANDVRVVLIEPGTSGIDEP